MVADVLALQQHGLVFKVLFVSRTILSNVYSLADLATRVPIHHSWVHPAILRTLCSNASFDRYPQKKRYFVLLSFFFFFENLCFFFWTIIVWLLLLYYLVLLLLCLPYDFDLYYVLESVL